MITNFTFLTVTTKDEFHSFDISEVSSHHIKCLNKPYMDKIWIVKVILKNGNDFQFPFSTLEEAKNSIKIIGDIRLM